MTASVKVGTPVIVAPAPVPASYVEPVELCDQQRRSMAYDAFAALTSRGY